MIKVSKLDLYPADEPTGYAVGFTYEANGRAGYCDTSVSFKQTKGKSQEEIIEIALESLAPQIKSQLEMFNSKSPLLGTVVELPEEK